MAQINGIKPISGLKLTTGLQVIGMLIGVLGFVGGIVLILAGIFGNGLVLLIAAVLTGMLFQAIAAALELLVSIDANTRATRDYLERLSQRAWQGSRASGSTEGSEAAPPSQQPAGTQ